MISNSLAFLRVSASAWWILFVCVFISTLAFAQTQPSNAQPQLNTIFVGAEGKFEAAPDTAVLRFDLAAQDTKSQSAYDKVSAAADRVRQVLKNNGIDPKTAEIGFYSVQPVYDWKSPKHTIIAYRVVTNVTLKLHDFAKVGDITSQTADLETIENQSLNYTLENIEPAKQKAAEDALRKARSEANAVAVAGGRSLGDLLYASVDISQPIVPVPIMARAMAAPGAAPTPPPTAEFTPQSVTITAHVNAMFGMK